MKLINQVNDKNLYKYYKACDLYVNPSYHEGFGRTNIEALMSKKMLFAQILKLIEKFKEKRILCKKFYVRRCVRLEV